MNLSETQLHSLTRSEVFALSSEDKQQYFYAIQVRHEKMGKIGEDLLRLLSPYNETNIIAVIGATGVGKTTLCKRLIKAHIEKNVTSPDEVLGTIPFIFTSVPANGSNKVSWAAFYDRVMQSAGEILIEKKHLNVVQDGRISVIPKRYVSLGAAREALESMLKNRKVRVLVIDEAYHLLRFGNYSAVMDTLKSLADDTGVKLLLIGSYDLFDLVTDYGQVARRAEILHFERYFIDNTTDVKEYKCLLAKLESYWPCKAVPSFQAIANELMEASLGCVGILKAILLQALVLQIERDGTWDPKFMASAAKSYKLLARIRKEIDDGEKKVNGATYGDTLFSGKVLEEITEKMNRAVLNG